MQHARIFSASVLERLFSCPGSAVLTADAERTSNTYSAWGTACHAVAADALENGDQVYAELLGTNHNADGFDFTVDDEMVDVAKFYTDYVRAIAAHDGTVLVEQRVSFREHLGLPDEHEAFGTADALVIKGNELIVIDLKTGRGVDVEVEGNAQLMAYALGCLEIAEQVADIERIRLVIVQPRAGGIKEHDLWVDELRAWAREHAAPAARRVLQAVAEFSVGHLNPGEKQCKFCSAKATCPALRDSVADTALGFTPASPDEFAVATVSAADEHTPEDWIAAALSRVDLIEDWCSSIRAEAHRRLSDGLPVPGWKLVQGKRGARAWSDPKAAEELLRKTFRLTVEQAYDLKLISPTSAEKLKKGGVIGERQWSKVAELITQPDGKPSVAPVTDPRPAIDARAVAEEFTTVAASN
jgi:hypothetical protein